MKKAREDAQDRVVSKKNNWNMDIFEVGNKVRVCDADKSSWSQKGIIIDSHKGQDGVCRSCTVETEDGGIIH